MRKLISIIGLELYALALAHAQLLNGVRTDEAKYLLNIPYPHPPLVRWLLGLFDGCPWQEICVRVLFATLMVQAVWIVWDMGRALKLPARLSVCVLWLGSAGFVLQAGTVMMAPITALEALAFLWLLSRPREALPGSASVAFLWLITVFTALQGVLLAPLAIAVLRLRGTPLKARLWYIGAPLVLVGLYALGNPLIMASFGLQAGKDTADTLLTRAEGLSWILVLAGSGVGTVIGIIGLILKKHWFILASFLLIALYVFVGRYDYYAILFLPFFITGAKHLYRRMSADWQIAVPATVLLVVCTALLLTHHVPLRTERSPARDTLKQLGSGVFLLKGSFGHEWQYEAASGQDLRLYTPALEPEATAVLCFEQCGDLEARWISISSIRGVWLKP